MYLAGYIECTMLSGAISLSYMYYTIEGETFGVVHKAV